MNDSRFNNYSAAGETRGVNFRRSDEAHPAHAMFDPSSLDAADRRHFYRRTAIPAICLLLVAGLHLFRVVNYDQTRWKGGGFGMFSTVDAETARFVRVELYYAETDRLVPIEIPDSLQKKEAELRALPDVDLAKGIATRLCRMRFRPHQSAEQRLGPGIISADDFKQAVKLAAATNDLAVDENDWRPTEDDSGWQPSAVNIFVMRHVYDASKKQLIAQKIFSTTVKASDLQESSDGR